MTAEIFRRITMLRQNSLALAFEVGGSERGREFLNSVLDEIETLLKSNVEGYERTIMNLSASLKTAQETVTACQAENTRLVELRRAAEAELERLKHV